MERDVAGSRLRPPHCPNAESTTVTVKPPSPQTPRYTRVGQRAWRKSASPSGMPSVVMLPHCVTGMRPAPAFRIGDSLTVVHITVWAVDQPALRFPHPRRTAHSCSVDPLRSTSERRLNPGGDSVQHLDTPPLPLLKWQPAARGGAASASLRRGRQPCRLGRPMLCPEIVALLLASSPIRAQSD